MQLSNNVKELLDTFKTSFINANEDYKIVASTFKEEIKSNYGKTLDEILGKDLKKQLTEEHEFVINNYIIKPNEENEKLLDDFYDMFWTVVKYKNSKNMLASKDTKGN